MTGTNLPANFQCGPGVNGPAGLVSITTSAGNGGIFNGRWLRICFKIRTTTTRRSIRPSMSRVGGRSATPWATAPSASTDLTTWKVQVRGNPVHLVIP